MKVGDRIHGKIVKITNYGAFVEIEKGKWGLVHISKIAEGYVKNVSDHVKEGQEVDVVVIGIDENGKVSLSMILDNNKAHTKPKKIEEEIKPAFEDKLDKFLKDSEDKISKIRNARNRKTRGKR